MKEQTKQTNKESIKRRNKHIKPYKGTNIRTNERSNERIKEQTKGQTNE